MFNFISFQFILYSVLNLTYRKVSRLIEQIVFVFNNTGRSKYLMEYIKRHFKHIFVDILKFTFIEFGYPTPPTFLGTKPKSSNIGRHLWHLETA